MGFKKRVNSRFSKELLQCKAVCDVNTGIGSCLTLVQALDKRLPVFI